ncbi:hypothetical protein [Frigidibacter mobilis]|uniref:Lipoprotein with Yx(FWY)xxD motif n=1 Tax=Frigidibacter mobilis TaxID=1335048 RepID=A0A165SFQ9_9RHOB|nr:hypothetical protein [Frigidibacter mobilis]AMY67589.1 hypothetical protein AKL17_0327 [Frigidibacter mobilis]
MIRRLPLTMLALLAGPPALAATGIAAGTTALGPVLTDADGMTLYTFDRDSGGASACYDDCAVNWPPLPAPAGAAAEGDYAPSLRKDGTMQWTYKGMPLYTWIKDTKPGETTGEGVKGVWHVARP